MLLGFEATSDDANLNGSVWEWLETNWVPTLTLLSLGTSAAILLGSDTRLGRGLRRLATGAVTSFVPVLILAWTYLAGRALAAYRGLLGNRANRDANNDAGSDDDSLSFGWGVASSSEQSGMASDTSSEVGTPSPSVRSAPIGIPKRSARLAQLHDSA